MKIFISWSGDVSHKVALVLHEWLPSVIQSLEPYVSSENIDKGARWSTDISSKLEDSSFGILCVTEDNIDAPWLVFEAGALSKSVDKSRVTPFLFGVKNSDLQGPTLQFQSTSFDEEDVRKLVHTINGAADSDNLEEARLNDIFDVWWPKLYDKLSAIEVPKETKGQQKVTGSQEEGVPSSVLEEMLNLLRSQHRLLNSPEDLLPRAYLGNVLSSGVGFLERDHPVWENLENEYSALRNFANSGEEDQIVTMGQVRQYVESLEGPMNYILRRRHRRRRPARSSE